MKPISLTEYYANKINSAGKNYQPEDFAEEIVESIKLSAGNERVELTNEEFWAIYDEIIKVTKKLEPMATKMSADWDAEANDYNDARREGKSGRY